MPHRNLSLGEPLPAIRTLWTNAWSEFVPFLDYAPEIRRVIYSTNAIESLNARIRQATRARGHFPNEQAGDQVPLPRRAITRPERQRPRAVDEPWKPALNTFAITFEGRLF